MSIGQQTAVTVNLNFHRSKCTSLIQLRRVSTIQILMAPSYGDWRSLYRPNVQRNRLFPSACLLEGFPLNISVSVNDNDFLFDVMSTLLSHTQALSITFPRLASHLH
jgi:hypothetical protein